MCRIGTGVIGEPDSEPLQRISFFVETPQPEHPDASCDPALIRYGIHIVQTEPRGGARQNHDESESVHGKSEMRPMKMVCGVSGEITRSACRFLAATRARTPVGHFPE